MITHGSRHGVAYLYHTMATASTSLLARVHVSMASQRGQYYETQYFHGQNLIIAWVKSFVHGQILS